MPRSLLPRAAWLATLLAVLAAWAGAAIAAKPPPPPAAPVPKVCSDWFNKIRSDAQVLAHPPSPPAETPIGDPRYDKPQALLADLRRVQQDMKSGPLRGQCDQAAGYNTLFAKVTSLLDFYEKAFVKHCESWGSRTRRVHREWVDSGKASTVHARFMQAQSSCIAVCQRLGNTHECK